MRYVTARIRQNTRDEMYRIFVTDCLAVSVKSEKRYFDLVGLANDRTQPEVSGEEIKEKMLAKIKAIGGGDEVNGCI